MSYPQLLHAMMDSILSGDPAKAGNVVRGRKDFPASAQIGVYTEGYRLRLGEVLEAAYPALAAYLGSTRFTALAQGYVEATPSRYFNIDHYPIGFARYVVRESGDGFAGELGALEGAIHDVYQREESAAADAPWAQRMGDAIGQAPLVLRTAGALMAFSYPVDDYLSAFREHGATQKPEKADTWLMVLRHRNQVRRLPLEEGEYALLSLIGEGKTLEAALEDERFARFAEDEHLGTQLPRWLARWVNEGVLRQS